MAGSDTRFIGLTATRDHRVDMTANPHISPIILCSIPLASSPHESRPARSPPWCGSLASASARRLEHTDNWFSVFVIAQYARGRARGTSLSKRREMSCPSVELDTHRWGKFCPLREENRRPFVRWLSEG